ncbi:ALP1-like protein isoform X1, partial [Tanacetum coccineum]
VARDEKSLKFKRVQEAARKDIERAFGVLQVSGVVLHFADVAALFENGTRRTTPLLLALLMIV